MTADGDARDQLSRRLLGAHFVYLGAKRYARETWGGDPPADLDQLEQAVEGARRAYLSNVYAARLTYARTVQTPAAWREADRAYAQLGAVGGESAVTLLEARDGRAAS